MFSNLLLKFFLPLRPRSLLSKEAVALRGERDDAVVDGKLSGAKTEPFFDQEKLDQLRARQIDTVQYLDTVFERLYDMVPKNTYITVTADHGELFGEGGYFGHGPIQDDLVYEVPFLEGKIR